MSYPDLQSYLAALPSLVAGGASLHDLYTALRDVDDPSPRVFVDGLDPAGRIPVLATRDLQSPEFVPESDIAAPEQVTDPGTGDEAATPSIAWSDDDAVGRFAPLIEGEIDVFEFESALAWLAEAADPAAVLSPLTTRARKRIDSAGAYPAAVLLSVTDGRPFRGHRDSQQTAYTNPRNNSSLPAFDERIHEVIRMATGAEPPGSRADSSPIPA